MNPEWILAVGMGASLAIILVPILYVLTDSTSSNSRYDPVKAGVYECVQVYHDTRSTVLYDRCFDGLQESLK